MLFLRGALLMDKWLLYKVVMFLAMVLFFDGFERLRPGYKIDHNFELGINITALLIVIFSGEGWRVLLQKEFGALGLSIISCAQIKSMFSPAKILFAVAGTDFFLYWVHRAMHQVDFLWPTHAFHHSLSELWWLSGSRTSVTHLLLFAIPQVIFADFFLQLNALEITIGAFVSIGINIWVHTNLRMDIGPLRWLFITPNYHRVHHGRRQIAGKNLGFVFTIWDRMFGTYLDPREVGPDFPLGYSPTKERLFRMMIGF
jgi:sterol desaturase/sphingolipid hydroxylase (fatty acid hydroxylase superfamily)